MVATQLRQATVGTVAKHSRGGLPPLPTACQAKLAAAPIGLVLSTLWPIAAALASAASSRRILRPARTEGLPQLSVRVGQLCTHFEGRRHVALRRAFATTVQQTVVYGPVPPEPSQPTALVVVRSLLLLERLAVPSTDRLCTPLPRSSPKSCLAVRTDECEDYCRGSHSAGAAVSNRRRCAHTRVRGNTATLLVRACAHVRLPTQ